MTTLIIGWVLVVLGTGQPVAQFKGEDNGDCIRASYVYSFRTGVEVRCVPRYQVVR